MAFRAKPGWYDRRSRLSVWRTYALGPICPAQGRERRLRYHDTPHRHGVGPERPTYTRHTPHGYVAGPESPTCARQPDDKGLRAVKGYVQVYTGSGKGKTTAAFGLALRAAGAGLKTFVAQFLKGMDSSELEAIKRFSDLIVLRQYGTGSFILGEPTQEDREAAAAGFAEVKEAVASRDYDLVILDEINVAMRLSLISVDEVLELIETRPHHVELVLTGRNADARIVERADLVTEMREVKHYYTQGVQARKGIER